MKIPTEAELIEIEARARNIPEIANDIEEAATYDHVAWRRKKRFRYAAQLRTNAADVPQLVALVRELRPS